MRSLSKSIVLLSVAATMVLIATDAHAIPAFARKTKLGCNTCHTLFPQLNRFDRDFRDNGFRTPDEIESLLKKRPSPPTSTAGPETPPAGDFWSFIPEQIPLSIQAKLHDAINPKGAVKSDFQLEELQFQSGGTFTPRVSYVYYGRAAATLGATRSMTISFEREPMVQSPFVS